MVRSVHIMSDSLRQLAVQPILHVVSAGSAVTSIVRGFFITRTSPLGPGALWLLMKRLRASDWKFR